MPLQQDVNAAFRFVDRHVFPAPSWSSHHRLPPSYSPKPTLLASWSSEFFKSLCHALRFDEEPGGVGQGRPAVALAFKQKVPALNRVPVHHPLACDQPCDTYGTISTALRRWQGCYPVSCHAFASNLLLQSVDSHSGLE